MASSASRFIKCVTVGDGAVGRPACLFATQVTNSPLITYPQFLITSVQMCRASYENVLKKWIPELQHYAPGIPVVLVGTKLDLREDKHYLTDHPGLVPVTTAQGEELRKQIGAAYYIECSSKTQQNVKAVFDAAIKVVIRPVQKQKEKKKKPRRGCLSNVLRGRSFVCLK
ncbi:hypothetical protein SLA2020_446350 [Shorea laevis]